MIQAKYVRLYVQTGNAVNVWEWISSSRLLANEIIGGQLEITDQLSDAPLIKVTASSVDRLKLGKIGANYGIEGYDASGNSIFELTDNATKISNWNITPKYLYSLSSGTPNSSPVGGLVLNASENSIQGYNSGGTKIFEAIYSGTNEGDFYVGDYNATKPGIFYDHSASTLNMIGNLLVKNGGNIRVNDGGYVYLDSYNSATPSHLYFWGGSHGADQYIDQGAGYFKVYPLINKKTGIDIGYTSDTWKLVRMYGKSVAIWGYNASIAGYSTLLLDTTSLQFTNKDASLNHYKIYFTGKDLYSQTYNDISGDIYPINLGTPLSPWGSGYFKGSITASSLNVNGGNIKTSSGDLAIAPAGNLILNADVSVKGTGAPSILRMKDSDDNMDGAIYANSGQVGILDSDLDWAYQVINDDAHYWYITASLKMMLDPNQLQLGAGVNLTNASGDLAVTPAGSLILNPPLSLHLNPTTANIYSVSDYCVETFRGAGGVSSAYTTFFRLTQNSGTYKQFMIEVIGVMQYAGSYDNGHIYARYSVYSGADTTLAIEDTYEDLGTDVTSHFQGTIDSNNFVLQYKSNGSNVSEVNVKIKIVGTTADFTIGSS